MLAFWMRSGSICASDGLVANRWDLPNAYNQVSVFDEAYDCGTSLAVRQPGCNAAKIFKQRVLPLGPVASVTAILKVSLALGRLESALLRLMWSVYLGDFLCLARRGESQHVDFFVDALFSLLGWHIPKHKLMDFNSLCKGLGVQLDPMQSSDRACFITNTKERVQELFDTNGWRIKDRRSVKVRPREIQGQTSICDVTGFRKKVSKVAQGSFTSCH